MLQCKIQNKNESVKSCTTVLSLLRQMKGNYHVDISCAHQHSCGLRRQFYFNIDNNNDQQEETEGFNTKHHVIMKKHCALKKNVITCMMIN